MKKHRNYKHCLSPFWVVRWTWHQFLWFKWGYKRNVYQSPDHGMCRCTLPASPPPEWSEKSPKEIIKDIEEAMKLVQDEKLQREWILKTAYPLTPIHDLKQGKFIPPDLDIY